MSCGRILSGIDAIGTQTKILERVLDESFREGVNDGGACGEKKKMLYLNIMCYFYGQIIINSRKKRGIIHGNS